jgi:ABC-type transporter Mla subunit MlaD
MNNLQKFDNTIEELGKELVKLKGTTDAYQKLQGLITSYAKINELFAQNSKSLEEFAAQQKKKQEELANTLTTLHNQNKEGKDELKKQNTVFEKNISLLIENLRKENKDFYLDFEKTVKIKLDDNKSEIKRLIESERLQIKAIFEAEISKRTAEIIANQKGLQTTIWIIGALLAILNIVVLVKLFQ